jgi:hypothetical protein
MTNFIESIFKDFNDGFIIYLSLVVTFWVVGYGEMVLDVEFFTNMMEFLVLEWVTIVSDNILWDTIPKIDVI